jgi:RHS repeat-associated protein
LQDLRYFYDPVGNIVEVHDFAQQTVYFDNAEVEPHQLFEYDSLYRLVLARGREHSSLSQPTHSDFTPEPLPHPNDPAPLRNYEQTYAYDEVGNITRMAHQAGNGSFTEIWTRGYDYDGYGNRLLATSLPGDDVEDPETYSATYTHDAHGNMTAMPHLDAIDWDHADQMQHADLGGGGDVYFQYDASGNRVRKVRVNQSGSAADERVYLGTFELYRERAVNSPAVLGDVDLERETLHVADDTGRIVMVETLTIDEGTPVSSPANISRYQYGNHLGTATVEADDNADLISYEEFHPYGTTSYAARDSGIEVSAKRYRYIGKERDEETGLYQCGARYLAAWLGRWTAADPIGLGDGVNRYAYAGNRPIGSRDASGTAEDDVLRNLEVQQAELIQQIADPSAATPERLAELERLTAEIAEEQASLARDNDVSGATPNDLGNLNEDVNAPEGPEPAPVDFEGKQADLAKVGHFALDVVGVAPGWIGLAADAANAVWYAAEGDWGNAALSGASAVGGDIVKGGKLAEGLTSGGIHFSSGGAKISTRAARTQTVGVPTGKEAPAQATPGAKQAEHPGQGETSLARGPARQATEANLRELPPGRARTPEENAAARQFYRNNRIEAMRRWEERTGKEWPTDAQGNPWWAEHPRPLKEGGDPLHVEPGAGPDPNAIHNIPGPDGLTDAQRWGAMGPPARGKRKR